MTRILRSTTFEAAQKAILSSAPAVFGFSNPPSIRWWRAKFSLNLAAAVFLDHYQSVLGASASAKDAAYGEANWACHWQANAGISPKQWEGVRNELGVNG
jgi:hypothetical protein